MKRLILVSLLGSGIFFDMHAMLEGDFGDWVKAEEAGELGVDCPLGRNCKYDMMLGLICKNLPGVTISKDIRTITELKKEIARKYNTSPDLLVLKLDRAHAADILLEFDDLPMKKLWEQKVRVLQGPSAEKVAAGLKWYEQELLKKFEKGHGFPAIAESIYYGTQHSYYSNES